MNEFLPRRIERAVEADAKQSVNNEFYRAFFGGVKFFEGSINVSDVDQLNFPRFQMRERRAGVVAVVAITGENEDGIAFAGERQQPLSNQLANALDYGLFLAAS